MEAAVFKLPEQEVRGLVVVLDDEYGWPRPVGWRSHRRGRRTGKLLLDRQHDRENTSLAELAGNADIAAVQRRQTLGEREPEASSLL